MPQLERLFPVRKLLFRSLDFRIVSTADKLLRESEFDYTKSLIAPRVTGPLPI